jgi:NAD-dependent SIR2 family protein deacetylase
MRFRSEPHEGYAALRKLIGSRPYFIVTSNIDGYFRRAGYDSVWETVYRDNRINSVILRICLKILSLSLHLLQHGSTDFFQCSKRTANGRCPGVWPWTFQKDANESAANAELDHINFVANLDSVPRCFLKNYLL